MVSEIAHLKYTDLSEGQTFAHVQTISAGDLDRFAELSGDLSPLHMDSTFAQCRGFKDRVVHGMLLGSFVSAMIGVRFPGANSLVHSMNLQFVEPAYVGDRIRIELAVSQLSAAVETVVLKIRITNTASEILLARGKAQVGLIVEEH